MKHAEKYLCQCCNTQQPAEHFNCQFSSKGGKATGKRKARTSEQAAAAGRAGAAKRWANQKKKALPKQRRKPKN